MKITKPIHTLEKFITDHALDRVFDRKMLSALECHTFDAGERILEEGDGVSHLYLVVHGNARVMPSSMEGKSGFLEYILPIDIIGDMEYFTGSPYVHSVDALTPCTYLAIPVATIEGKFSNDPAFYRFICENMAAKMKRTSARYSRTLLYPLKNRLAKFLLDQAGSQKGKAIPLNTTQTAEYFAVTPRHLRRVLSDLEDAAIIRRTRHEVVLKDLDALKAMSRALK